jgi:DNA repair photolyase
MPHKISFDKAKASKLFRLKHQSSYKNNYKALDNKSLPFVSPNGRSTDFVLTTPFVKGCPLNCSYCYVTRRNNSYDENYKPFPSNPINIATDVDDMLSSIKNFVDTLPATKSPNQCHPVYYTLDIGEYSDMLSPNFTTLTNYIISQLVPYKTLATSFASKISTPTHVKRLIDCPIPYKARIRASVSPQWVITQTEVGTASIVDRLNGLNLAFDKGYEVHLNFSPMIITNTFEDDYSQLMKLIRSIVSKDVLNQLQYEGIFLTHNRKLHIMNERFFPTNSESLLWTPHNQELAQNLRNNEKIRYIWSVRSKYITLFRSLISQYLPECKERYLF